MTARVNCRICDELPPGDLTELDLFMGDASRWPVTVWGIFDPPKGRMTPARQRFGGIQAGRMWLAEHGYADRFSDAILRRHHRYDVVVLATSPEDLINRGLMVAGPGRADRPLPTIEAIDPKAFLTYFDRGIKLGNRSLQILAERVEAMVNRGEEVPLSMLKTLAELGGKLATTQAQLQARGARLGDDPDEDEGFRAGSAPLPSQRMGHARVRVIDGEARPVADEGQADREHFSRRSKAEGGAGLPHR